MKYFLVLLLAFSSVSIAADIEKVDFKKELSTLVKMNSSHLKQFLTTKKSYKRNGHHHLVCKQVTKVSKNGVLKKKRVKKVVFGKNGVRKKVKFVVLYDENGKKIFKSPIEIREIENDNPNLLTIELDSKNIKNNEKEKFTPIKAKYKVFEPEVNFKDRSGKLLANLYEVDGLQRFDVDISELESGEHDLFVRVISNKTVHIERREKKLAKAKKNKKLKPLKKFIHKVSIRFEKQAPKLLPNLALVDSDEFKSRVMFDMSGSGSDQGEIVSYKTTLIGGGEVLDTKEYNVLEDGTRFGYVFTDPQDYQIELEIFDEAGNSAKVLSEVITPIKVAPVLNYTLTQNDEFRDLFEIDFAGSLLPADANNFSFFGINVIQNGVVVEEKYSIVDNFEFQIKSRGDFRLLILVGADSGTVNIEVDPLNHLAQDLDESLVLNYSHHFFDQNDPRRLFIAFNNQISQEDFK